MRKHLLTFSLLGLLLSQGFAQPQLLVESRRATSAPLRLTSSDGTGMRLTRYEARVVVQGPLAFTELHLRFHNPQDRVLEGRFAVTLPEGAALSRLAMKSDQGWQEAEVVELQAARVAYEDFLHRRQDPALLEKQAGNEFQARVFPLPAGGDKELILSYSQEVTGDYRLPVSGLPKVDELSVKAVVGEQKLSYSLHSESPKGDFVIRGHQVPRAMTQGQDALLVVKPQVQASRAESFDLLVLVDTSASRAAGYGAQVRKVRDLLAEWKRRHPEARVQLAAFDQKVVPLAGVDDLARRRPLGATDLGAALRWASAQKLKRVVLVSDGVSTAGKQQLTAHQRLDAVMLGGIRDGAALQPLVYGHGGFMLDGEAATTEIVTRLESKPASGVKVRVAGADWVWPPVLDGVAPGESRVVYAHLSKPAREVQVSLGEAPAYGQPLAEAPGALLHRAVVGANLARLNQQRLKARGEKRAELARHMVEISTGNRVVCDLTGLLILESEADYQRFKIDRRALAQILVAGEQGVEVHNRSQVVLAPTPPRQEVERKESEGESDKQLYLEDGATTGVRLPVAAKETVILRQAGPAEPARTARPVLPPPNPEPADQGGTRDGDGMPPLNGNYEKVDRLLRQGKSEQALLLARGWQAREPGDVLALVALGRSLQACGKLEEAARAYGSIIDLFPGRADLRRYAGGLLESLGKSGQALACDSYRRSVEQRPDHPSGSRMLAYNLLRQGRAEEAFATLEKAFTRQYHSGRFAEVKAVLSDDLGMVAAALIASNPDLRPRVIKKLHALGVPLASKPSLRFVLTWETDANDVDFHIKDGRGGHAYYSQPELPSGGRLYGDVTTGYGPECFNIVGEPRAYPYDISIHYYSRGPMGYGMGKVEIVRFDGKGHFRFEQRPFVVMNDQATVELGRVKD